MHRLAAVTLALAGCTSEHTFGSAMEPLEPDLTMPLAVQIHDRQAWSLEYDGTVRAISLDTGDARVIIPAGRVVAPNEIVVEPSAYDLVVTSDAIYWSYRGTLSRAALDGTARTTLFSSDSLIWDFAVAGDTVCWTGHTLAACLPHGATTPIPFPADPAKAHAVATDGTTVYWGEYNGAIHAAPIAGGSAVTLADHAVAPRVMRLVDRRLYWLDGGSSNHDAEIASADLDDHSTRVDLGGFLTVDGFAVDGDDLFVEGDETLWKKRSDAAREKLDIFDSCMDLAVDARDIVCASLFPDRGSLERLSR